ncbi:MAG: hypothetical protein Kow0059_21800 [Candidatus Sumerlaeia bacterium]
MKIIDITDHPPAGPHGQPDPADPRQAPWILGSFQLTEQTGGQCGPGCCQPASDGDVCLTHEMSFCARVMSGLPEFLSFHIAHAGESSDGEPGLVKALRGALFEPLIAGAPRPPYLLVASEADRRRLELSGGTYGLMVRVDPEVGRLVNELGAFFAEMQESGVMELATIVPVPDEKTITAELATTFLDAALEFWRAEPWNGLNEDDVFHLQFPGGRSRFVTLMGQGKEEFGALFFHSLEDFHRFTIAGVTNMMSELLADGSNAGGRDPRPELNQLLAELPEDARVNIQEFLDNPPQMPAVLGLHFEQPEHTPGVMEQYLGEFAPQWMKEPLRPIVVNCPSGMAPGATIEAEPPSADDFALVRDAALALARLSRQQRELNGWPPRPDFEADVPIGEQPGAPVVHVQFIPGGGQ